MEKPTNLRRRGLLKAGGAIAAGVPLAAAAFITRGARASGRAYKRGWWIKSVVRPTLAEKNGTFRRFSGANMFALYPKLKDERDGEGSFERENAAKDARTVKWIQQAKPGFSLRDLQLGESAWTLMNSMKAGEGLLSWTRVSVRTPAELGVPAYSARPREAAATVKAAARLFGAGLAGIAPMNESYVNLQEQGRPVVFEDVGAPAVTDEKFVIPRKMKWVVVLAIPMDLDLLSRVPSAVGDAASGLGYSHSAFAVASLAEFIRGLGYQAIPSINDTAQSVPFAMEAGLGELSRMNKLVTPEFGPAVRLCKVFTDLPMTCDRPVDFGVVEFCKRCRKCAEACPSGALSLDDEPSFQTRGAWNNPGHKAWFEDSYRCFSQWQASGTACAVCLAACPFTKASETWIHEVVKATVSLTPATDGLFRTIDNALGYGEQKDPERWWMQDAPSSSRPA
jgi:reductive dehalogenase